MNYLAIDRSSTDKQGRPIAFAIDVDGGLSATFSPDRPSGAWRKLDLATAGMKARVFGVSQNSRGEIYLVAGMARDAAAPLRLFRTGALANDPDHSSWESVAGKWSELALNPHPGGITELLVGAPEDATEQPLVVLGTTGREGKVPTYLRLKSEIADSNTERFPDLENPDELLDIVAGRSSGAQGVYVLYRRVHDIVLQFKGVPDEYGVPLNATLEAPPGAIGLDTEADKGGGTSLIVTGNGLFRFSADNQLSGATAEKIAADDGMLADRISCRSSLTTEYGKNPAGRLEPYPVYRTSVSLPPGTAIVDLWAESQVEVEVNGRKYSIDAVKPVRIAAPQALKLSISIRAGDNLHCPRLTLNTNLMRPEQRHWICPDAEVHKKLAQLKPGALYEARHSLGIGSRTKEELDAAQSAIQNLARTVQYTYNRRQHGVFHDRAILPQNMADCHFRLGFEGGHAQYRPLGTGAVQSHVAGATPGTGAAQGLWDDFVAALGKAANVVFYTAKDVVNQVADTVERIGKDVSVAFDRLGEDLVRGDALSFAKHLLQGGAAVGTDLFVGAANVVGRVLSGAGQLLAVALDLGGKIVNYVLDHSGAVGQAIRAIFQRIGAEVVKVVAWLLEEIGGPDVVHVHDTLIDAFNGQMDGLKNGLEHVKKIADRAIVKMESDIDKFLDGALRDLGGPNVSQEPERPWSISAAVEQCEWLVARMPDAPADNPPGPDRIFSLKANIDAVERFFTTLDAKLGFESPLFKALERDAKELLQSLTGEPQAVLRAALKLLKSLSHLVLEGAKALVDGIVDLLEAVIQFLKEILNAPFDIPFVSDVYKEITKREQCTVLGLVSLILAIPVGLAYQTVFGVAVPKLKGAAAELPPPPKNADAVKFWGIFYGVTRILDGVFAGAIDAYTGVGAKKAAAAQAQIADQLPSNYLDRFKARYQYGLGPSQGEWMKLNMKPAEFYPDMLFRSWGMVAGLLQVGSTMPTSDLTFGLAVSGGWERITNLETLTAPEDRPNYWGAVYFWTIYTQFMLSVILSGITIGVSRWNLAGRGGKSGLYTKMGFTMFNDAQTVIESVFGILTTGFTSALDAADRNKTQSLKSTYFDLDGSGEYITSTDSSWQADWGWRWTKPDENGRDTNDYFVPKQAFKNLALSTDPKDIATAKGIASYLKWAEQGGLGQPARVAGVKRMWGIERKGFGNVVGCLEGVGKLGAVSEIATATEGFSLIPTVVLDVLGGLGEGITVIVRIANNEIY